MLICLKMSNYEHRSGNPLSNLSETFDRSLHFNLCGPNCEPAAQLKEEPTEKEVTGRRSGGLTLDINKRGITELDFHVPMSVEVLLAPQMAACPATTLVCADRMQINPQPGFI